MTDQPALPDVAGRCPACNGESLMLADGGYVTCRRLECPQPDAAHEAIEERAGANAYDRAINALMSEQAAAHLRECLASGDVARRKVRRREPTPECPDACTEHHTYGPDCAATAADYDPNAGMRERYIDAIRAYFGGPTQCTAAFAGQLADAVLAARDVHLNNVRRISKQQTTQLAELYMTTKKRAEQAEAKLATLAEIDRGDCAPTADEYEASQRRAIRIQTLLDDTRDRARRDAIAGRESERILQQQIDRQATEIDRLRDDYRKATSALVKVTAQAMAAPPLEQFMGDEPTEYAQGWAAAMSRIEAALEPPKENPCSP